MALPTMLQTLRKPGLPLCCSRTTSPPSPVPCLCFSQSVVRSWATRPAQMAVVAGQWGHTPIHACLWGTLPYMRAWTCVRAYMRVHVLARACMCVWLILSVSCTTPPALSLLLLLRPLLVLLLLLLLLFPPAEKLLQKAVVFTAAVTRMLPSMSPHAWPETSLTCLHCSPVDSHLVSSSLSLPPLTSGRARPLFHHSCFMIDDLKISTWYKGQSTKDHNLKQYLTTDRIP